MRLFTQHPRALSILYEDVVTHARSQPKVFVGTAGSIVERTNASGFRFYAHQFYDGAGKRRERYLAGPVGSAAADTSAREMLEQISETKELVASLRLLGREGFHLVDARSYAVLASLHNHGVFAAGGMLIGSHAYGTLLNQLGARAAPYATEDIDIARRGTLEFSEPPTMGIQEMLESSGMEFVAVPELRRGAPPTSYKLRGRSRFHLDLLASSRTDELQIVSIPELGAHATALPHLGYLLADSQPGVIMARQGCCAVRVPLAERFAIHKLIVSRLRTGRSAKSNNDVLQACVLCAALAESHPGAIESALADVPRRAKKLVAAALEAARPILEVPYPRAWMELCDKT